MLVYNLFLLGQICTEGLNLLFNGIMPFLSKFIFYLSEWEKKIFISEDRISPKQIGGGRGVIFHCPM